MRLIEADAEVETPAVSDFEAKLRRRLGLLFYTLTGGLFVLLAAALAWFSIDQDRRASDMSQRIARSAVAARDSFMAKTIQDYAKWDDAYQNVVLAPDRAWMDGNIGPFVFDSLKFEKSYIIDGDGRPAYAMEGNKVVSPLAVDPAIAALVEQANRENGAKPLARIVDIEGKPALAAAARIVPSSPALTFDSSRIRTLVFVDFLDSQVLGEMQNIYLLDDLAISPAVPEGANGIAIGEDGKSGWLHWRQQKPGRAMLGIIAPIVAALGLLLALAGNRMMRMVESMISRMMEDRRVAEDAIARARVALAAAQAAKGDAEEARKQLDELVFAHRQLDDLRKLRA